MPFIIIMACTSTYDIDVQGHRGCRGLMPENSLPAFKKAIELGVSTLELDIAITKDDKVIVSHEPFMSRTICLNSTKIEISEDMDMKYNLYQMTHEEIIAFDCGSKFHPSFPKQKKLAVYKPLLTEVFDLVKELNSLVNLNIEIKSKPSYYGVYTPQPEVYVKLVLEEIRASGFSNRCSLQSFDVNILEEIKIQAPRMEVALLVDEHESINSKLNELTYKPEIISPFYRLITKKSVEDYRKKGYKIIPWTINEEQDMETILKYDVDGIITDYPDRLLSLLQN